MTNLNKNILVIAVYVTNKVNQIKNKNYHTDTRKIYPQLTSYMSKIQEYRKIEIKIHKANTNFTTETAGDILLGTHKTFIKSHQMLSHLNTQKFKKTSKINQGTYSECNAKTRKIMHRKCTHVWKFKQRWTQENNTHEILLIDGVVNLEMNNGILLLISIAG